jgi:hypothetical protein
MKIQDIELLLKVLMVLFWGGIVAIMLFYSTFSEGGYFPPYMEHPVTKIIGWLLIIWQLMGSIYFVRRPLGEIKSKWLLPFTLFFTLCVIPNFINLAFGSTIQTSIYNSLHPGQPFKNGMSL